MTCTHCDAGFLNLHQVDDETLARFEATGDVEVILNWIAANSVHDVQVCDCCGDGENWYGTPGEHNPHDLDDPAAVADTWYAISPSHTPHHDSL